MLKIEAIQIVTEIFKFVSINANDTGFGFHIQGVAANKVDKHEFSVEWPTKQRILDFDVVPIYAGGDRDDTLYHAFWGPNVAIVPIVKLEHKKLYGVLQCGRRKCISSNDCKCNFPYMEHYHLVQDEQKIMFAKFWNLQKMWTMVPIFFRI